MLLCAHATRLIARHADGEALDEQAGAALDAHLIGCRTCREALAEQRAVADLLRARPAERVSPSFAARLAERLDEQEGWFGLLDWRRWTIRLAPAAAAVAIGALVTAGEQESTPISLEDWALTNAGDASAASLLWNAEVSSDAVLQQMLGADDDAPGGSSDGR